MDKLPAGTLVDYHGSLTHMHGRYEVTEISAMDYQRARIGDEAFDAHYTEGFAYNLWPVGVPRKFGNRHLSLLFVRPSSITVIT